MLHWAVLYVTSASASLSKLLNTVVSAAWPASDRLPSEEKTSCTLCASDQRTRQDLSRDTSTTTPTISAF